VGLRAGLDRYGKSRLHRDSIPDRPAPSESLYRLRYPAHNIIIIPCINYIIRALIMMTPVPVAARSKA
jgi:hypothetical protein